MAAIKLLDYCELYFIESLTLSLMFKDNYCEGVPIDGCFRIKMLLVNINENYEFSKEIN